MVQAVWKCASRGPSCWISASASGISEIASSTASSATQIATSPKSSGTSIRASTIVLITPSTLALMRPRAIQSAPVRSRARVSVMLAARSGCDVQNPRLAWLRLPPVRPWPGRSRHGNGCCTAAAGFSRNCAFGSAACRARDRLAQGRERRLHAGQEIPVARAVGQRWKDPLARPSASIRAKASASGAASQMKTRASRSVASASSAAHCSGLGASRASQSTASRVRP